MSKKKKNRRSGHPARQPRQVRPVARSGTAVPRVPREGQAEPPATSEPESVGVARETSPEHEQPESAGVAGEASPQPEQAPATPAMHHAEVDAQLEGRYAELVERERRVMEREIEADSGFARRNEDALVDLEARRDSLQEEIGDLGTRQEELAEALEAKLETRRSSHDRELDDERDDLAAQKTLLRQLQEGVDRDRRQLEDERFQLTMEREDVAQEHAQVEARVDRGIARERGELEGRIALTTAERDAARTTLDGVRAGLMEAERRALAFGGRDAEQVLAELDDYRQRYASLEAEHARTGNTDLKEELTSLRNERDGMRVKNGELMRTQGELRGTLERLRSDVNERELLGARLQAAERHRDVLRHEVDELSSRFDHLLAKDHDQAPFARLSQIDDNEDDQRAESRRATAAPVDLEALVTNLRHWLAAQPERLYYGERELRLFIAGLAASRLHVIEGISGTGKTTLPRAVAKALHGRADVVEVQAGWRDREDLLGHYNTFERRYAETSFIEALYRAQSPAWAAVPYFVVLDEMNLSHPEQYFADLLSLLAREGDEHLLLTTQPLSGLPRLLTSDGRLHIPPNVWFIGTANHDETTLLFADKTYDRSHVMTLPDKPTKYDPPPSPARPAVSYNSLRRAFGEAKDQRADGAGHVWNWLEREMRETFNDEFDVGWGPRLEQQLQNFVPVVLAAGGDVGEATDHVLATKLLRKVRDRHDVDFARLRDLQRRIESSWSSLEGARSRPTAAMTLLRRERRKKGDSSD